MLNRINTETLVEAYGDETDGWLGKLIELVVARVQFGAKMVDGIRVRAPQEQENEEGYLREGYWADVCVLNPQTVGPGPLRRVRDFPAGAERLTAEEPTGVRYVLVNGTPIFSDGRSLLDSLERRPGMRPEIA